MNESPTIQRCRKQRSRLVGDRPWFGALALRLGLHVESAPRVDTMATDGTRLYVNEDWCGAQADGVLRSALKHEVLHCVLEHMYRIGGRELDLFNVAADHVVNLMLRAEGDELWPGAYADERFAGMAAEQVYAILERERRDEAREQEQQQKQDAQASQDAQDDQGGAADQPQDQPGSQGQPSPSQAQPADPTAQGAPQPGQPAPGQGQPDAQGEPAGQPSDQGAPQPGQFLPAPEGEMAPGEPGSGEPVVRMSVEDWRVAVEQATRVDEKAGRMGGDLARAVRAVREPRLDWVEILRRFVARIQPTNYAWSSPRRGMLSQGIYLPGMEKSSMPALAIAIDTSGSIGPEELAVFEAEIRAIVEETRPAALHVIYADSRVCGVDRFDPDGEPVKLTMRGGGGTRLQPAIDEVARLVEESDEPPAALVYFTDLISSDHPVEPCFPTLWVREARSRRPAPFGELVTMDEGDRR